MSTPNEDTPSCPECKGAGRVLLLFSWVTCPDCEGTGVWAEEDRPTGEYPVIRDKDASSTSDRGPGAGSGTSSGCDEEHDDAYFHDGLELDDLDTYGDVDTSRWEGDDS